MKRNDKFIRALLVGTFSLFAVGCFHDDSSSGGLSGADKKELTDKLVGTWEGQCSNENGKLVKSYYNELKFLANGTVKNYVYEYSAADCPNSGNLLKDSPQLETFTYKLGAEVTDENGKTGNKIDLDFGGGDVFYDIFRIGKCNGGKDTCIYSGKETNELDGSTSAKRPVTFSTEPDWAKIN